MASLHGHSTRNNVSFEIMKDIVGKNFERCEN